MFFYVETLVVVVVVGFLKDRRSWFLEEHFVRDFTRRIIRFSGSE